MGKIKLVAESIEDLYGPKSHTGWWQGKKDDTQQRPGRLYSPEYKERHPERFTPTGRDRNGNAPKYPLSAFIEDIIKVLSGPGHDHNEEMIRHDIKKPQYQEALIDMYKNNVNIEDAAAYLEEDASLVDFDEEPQEKSFDELNGQEDTFAAQTVAGKAKPEIKRGDVTYEALKALEKAGEKGLRYIDLVKIMHDYNFGPGSSEKNPAIRGYNAGMFRGRTHYGKMHGEGPLYKYADKKEGRYVLNNAGRNYIARFEKRKNG